MRIGIDLGTTYSYGAYLDRNGSPRVISDGIPSVVMIDNGNVIVGRTAKENLVIRPRDIIVAVKQAMGTDRIYTVSSKNVYSPEMISGFIIEKVIQEAEDRIGEKVDEVVVTVPADFNSRQREATREAVSKAGVRLVGMINEPAAAALCYAYFSRKTDENVMVYDMGGGTFDMTVLNITRGKIKILATGGLDMTGGRLFDEEIVDYVCKVIEDRHGIDLQDEEYVEELQELYIKAEKCKIALSEMESSTIVMKVGSIKENITVTREQFENWIAPSYKRTEAKVSEILTQAGLTFDDIDTVMITGGSGRIPYIRRSLAQLTGKSPVLSVDPEAAVSLGAAIYAAAISEETKSMRCTDSIGIVVVDSEGNEKNHVVIPRGTQIPVSISKRFRTTVYNQERIELRVTRGEGKDIDGVETIKNITIELPQGMQAHSVVEAEFILDAGGIFTLNIRIPQAQIDKCFKGSV